MGQTNPLKINKTHSKMMQIIHSPTSFQCKLPQVQQSLQQCYLNCHFLCYDVICHRYVFAWITSDIDVYLYTIAHLSWIQVLHASGNLKGKANQIFCCDWCPIIGIGGTRTVLKLWWHAIGVHIGGASSVGMNRNWCMSNSFCILVFQDWVFFAFIIHCIYKVPTPSKKMISQVAVATVLHNYIQDAWKQ